MTNLPELPMIAESFEGGFPAYLLRHYFFEDAFAILFGVDIWLGYWTVEIPREAASLKDTPDVIQCDQCAGIFPSEFIHIKSIFRYGAYFDRIDLCEACWKGLGR